MDIIKKINDSRYVVVHHHTQLAVITREKYHLGWILRVYNIDDVYYHDGSPKEGSEAIFESPRGKFEDMLSLYFSLMGYKKG